MSDSDCDSDCDSDDCVCGDGSRRRCAAEVMTETVAVVYDHGGGDCERVVSKDGRVTCDTGSHYQHRLF